MAISPQKAKALCTAAEFKLVQESAPRSTKSLSAAQLKTKRDRTRTLRDKYRDLAKKQSGEARGKRAPTGRKPAKGNARTVEKAELFQDTLDRFEKALAKADGPAKESAVTAGKSKTAKKSTARASNTTARQTKKKTSRKSSKKSGAASAKTSEKPASASAKAPAKKKSKQQPAAMATGVSLAATPLPLGMRLGGGSLGAGASGGSFASLIGSGQGAQQSRETRRREKSQSSKIGREQSLFSRTAQEKIQGHVGAQTRRSQAKRDSK